MAGAEEKQIATLTVHKKIPKPFNESKKKITTHLF